MRILLCTAALFLASAAQAQVTCQQVGDNLMCSNGTIVYGSRSYTPPLQQGGGFAFGEGLAAGRGALESQSRQELLNQQAEQLRLQNRLLEQQIEAQRRSNQANVCPVGPRGFPECPPGVAYTPPVYKAPPSSR